MRYLSLAALALAGVLHGEAASADTPTLRLTTASSRIQSYKPGATGVTYDQKLAPAGAQLSVFAFSSSRSTTVVLNTRGLLPKREYGAHVHVSPCGQAPTDAGPHFQNKKDPIQPSVNPAYANPRNEIWLDFTTDRQGAGAAMATVPWGFNNRDASSIVIHATHTHTVPGQAGAAGARLACLTADF
ncbi:Cu-Zn family superoxide dismutase [Kibdelosporangium banguiense]|uniref:Cu-Zn family superoxide dismutase n=1 Tax=Kibdelosporangium banguiense TaxID=1365924 RepID=A0ABS4TJ22_9PSEU|nr:superoxide dismutase family protein [Kibdelosporangium banguiense]MBP2324405.1 Cu-Zn family superoxide dismutase [Kibdelosporangium banguiense]